MPTNKIPLPAPDSFTGLLIALAAVSGELPASQVGRLMGAMSYKQKAITKIKRDDLLNAYSRNNLRGYRLTSGAKRALVEQYPERYQPLLMGWSSTNAPKYSVRHRLRMHRMAEVLVTMLNAGALVFPWEKPAFPPDKGLRELSFTQSTYYSSIEVKEIGAQGQKIRGSRATGLLFAASALFAVYNVGAADMRWDHRAEMRLKALMQTDLCKYRFGGQRATHQMQAILFADDMSRIEKMLCDTERGPVGADSATKSENAQKAKTMYFLLYGSYEHFHVLTNDRHGEMLLRFLTERETKATLDSLLMNGLHRDNLRWGLEHDAFDQDGSPVLFGYSCDLPRIKRFDDALEKRQTRGTLICFDYQQPALKQLCGELVDFQCIDPDAVEEAVFDRQEKMD